MGEQDKTEGMLSPYRVLDLTDENGLLCGKLLGDLGADVIKIERPGGDSARNLGPFYNDKVDPEKSLFWFAFNTSKRGITLDIESTEGQEIFKKLVKGADFVIESFSPGYLDKRDLGYSALEKINPRIILVSITPFGQTGPYKDYKAPDIVAFATGGYMHPFGEPDRPPVRISHHAQGCLHASAEGAAGALMALHYREKTGEGQQVDVSIQESLAKCTYALTSVWNMSKTIPPRGGLQLAAVVDLRRVWPCKDGLVLWSFGSGVFARPNPRLVEWMDSEGMATDFQKEFDWDTFDLLNTTQDVIDRLEGPTAEFFMKHTKAELLEGAVKYRLNFSPVLTTTDILNSPQLASRGFWAKMEHPELGTSVTYPGAFAKTSEAPPRISRRAPLVGEHNKEVFEKELNISRERPLVDEKIRREYSGKKPLEGIRVVGFTWWYAGPQTTKTFADYGAEVVRIESRTRPDGQRLGGPAGIFKDDVLGVNRSGQFNQYATGNLSVCLNLTNPKGVEMVKRFIAISDVVVENFAGGVMERMGLGYEELKKVKSDIIMLSSSLQGQTGPHAALPGFGIHGASLSGFRHITGWPDREPADIGVYTDFIAPRFSVLTILAALDYRRRTGKGQFIDLSQCETGLHFLSPLLLDSAVNQRVAERVGNRYTYAAPHSAYPCRGEQRWCAIAVFTDEEWQSFCKVIGNPAWTKESKFRSLQARKENEAELDRLVGEWTINYSAEEVMNMMQAAGVAAGVVETAEDLLEHDLQLKHRHAFWELDHPEIGIYRAPGPPFVLSKSPYEVRRAPLLGEHNEYAFKEILGMSDDEIAELVIEGVIE